MEESEITGFILIGMGGMLILVTGFVVLFAVSQKQIRKQLEEKARLKEEHQQDLLKAAVDTQEKERSRIAAELHDQIGNDLQTLKLFLHQINQQELELQSTELLAQTILEVRNLSHELMPASLESLGLEEALMSMITRLNATEKLSCQLEWEGQDRLPPETELALYRIAQELVSNTLKHAQASEIVMKFERNQSGFLYEYVDNGIGLRKDSDTMENSGLGMKNIESRCQLIAATLRIHHDEPGMKISING
ncbi:MAG: histidine kinase [Cytophagales bacterium]|nr:histidine kinase [Cytophagales bacterium]